MTEDFPKLYVYSYVEDQARIHEGEAEIEPTLEALEAYYKERDREIGEYEEEYGYDDDLASSPLAVELSFDDNFNMTQTASGYEDLSETLQFLKDLYAIKMLLEELHIKNEHIRYGWFHVRIGGETKELRFSNRDKIVIGDPRWSARIFLHTKFDRLRKDLINFMAQ